MQSTPSIRAVFRAMFALALCGAPSSCSGDDSSAKDCGACSTGGSGGTSAGGSGGGASGGGGATNGGGSGGASSGGNGGTGAGSGTGGTGGNSGPFALGQRPFSASSSWNTPIASNAVFSAVSWPASTGYNYTVSWDTYSAAIFVSSPSDPVVDVSYPPSWGYPGGTLSIRMPPAADGAPGTDGELLIIDGTVAHNFWVFQRTSATTATAQAYGAADVVTGTGWGSASPFLGAGITAAGSSQMAGILVQAETDAGEIEHALNLRADSTLVKPGAVGEAISSDGSASNGIVQEAERLAIPPNTQMPSGLSPLGQKVFRALQKYGAFVTDVSGGATTLGAQQNAYDDPTMTALWHDSDKLIPLLEAVQ